MLGRRRDIEEMRHAFRRGAEGRVGGDVLDQLAIRIDMAAVLERAQIVLAAAHLAVTGSRVRLRHRGCSIEGRRSARSHLFSSGSGRSCDIRRYGSNRGSIVLKCLFISAAAEGSFISRLTVSVCNSSKAFATSLPKRKRPLARTSFVKPASFRRPSCIASLAMRRTSK